MAQGVQDGGTAGARTPAVGGATPTPPTGTSALPGKPRAGWYPDPWAQGQHRYWDGERWTSHSFPDGPAPPDRDDLAPPPPAGALAAPTPPPAAPSAAPPPPPEWSPPRPAAGIDEGPPPEPAPEAGGTAPWRFRLPQGRALLTLLMLAGLITGFSAVGIYYALTGSSKPTTRTAAPPPAQQPVGPSVPSTTPTPGTTPGGGQAPGASPGGGQAAADPSASVLSGLVVSQADVATNVTVQLLPGGNQVSGQPTLDLCNATFPSESLRTARLQVAAVDDLGDAQLSTEAVLYKNTAATVQAFSELRAAAANCPSGPVASPVGEPTATTHFNPAPDGAWPQVPGVERLAFDFVTTDQSGQSQHSLAVYLRRGRALLGVYFPHPDGAQSAVKGQTSIASIVNVFATRMAQLPAAAVNG